MAHTQSYTYVGVTFKHPQFPLEEAACARLSCGYATICALERQCAHLQFQEPQTKLWLIDTLVTPTLLYEVETQQWFKSHGIHINALIPLEYSLDCPHLNLTKVEKNRVEEIGSKKSHQK